MLAVLVPGAFAADAPVRLSEVQVEGVTVFSSEAIEATVEIGPGDPVDRSKIVRTAAGIQNLYRSHGYEQVSIATRLLKDRVLEIQVTEGNPTRIADVDFELEQSTMKSGQWTRLKRTLRAGIGIKPGDILDQDKLLSAKRLLLDSMAAEEYIDAKVDQIRELPADTPSTYETAPFLKSTGRWVNIRFTVLPRDRVTFGFRGNEVVSATRLYALLDEQRAVGLGQDFIATMRSAIEEEYRSMGYAKVSVQAYTFEKPEANERHITFDINEGRRVMIDSIDFDGNSVFTGQELRDRFFAVAPSFVQKRYYVEKDVRRAAELVIEWMKSKGYLGSKLVGINKAYVLRGRADEKDTRIRLVAYLYESEQTLVQSIHLSGSTQFSDAEIGKMLGVQEGAPLNIFAFGEGIEALKAAYRARGYLDVVIANEGTDKIIRYSDENRLADVAITILEGRQFRVSRIVIEGRRKTKEKVILREIPLHPGDVFEEPKLRESESRLRKLGIFSIARAQAVDDPERPDCKILKIVVDEADPGLLAGGPGFRNDLGARLFGQVGYSNLWGDDHSIFLNTEVNRRVDHTFRFAEYQTQLTYNWPWFANYDLTFRPSLSLSGTEYLLFDAVTADFALTWEKRLLRNPNLVGLFTYDIERVRQFDAQDAIDNDIFRIGSITPMLRLDMRDNPLAPMNGLYAQASFEYADPVLGSQRAPSPIGYWRLQSRTDYTVPLAPLVSLFLSVRTGFEKSTVARAGPDTYGEIPLIKQFALGGIGSLRGFSEQELNVQQEVIKGTLSYVNYRSQFDFPIAGQLRFGPFLDAANLRVDSFSFGALRYGTGFGFHYLTPLGPVNLDYGFKIAPQPGEDTSQFYFSIGVL